MKYCILDLSPHNSMAKHLVDQGFNVFMISWKNSGEADSDRGLEDYRGLGPMAALDAIAAIMPGRRAHAVGYCLAGTLLGIAVAVMAREGDARIRSLTFLAAQTDFTEAGELRILINESQLDVLDDLMATQGYLKGSQMAGAFQMLRSQDLIWSYALKSYLMGERAPMNGLMAWNADATRMPRKMHSEYLRRMFLDSDLAERRLQAGERPVALNDLHEPIFALGTERDQVAPWRSTFKIHLFTDVEATYVLTSGGHNAGIVSEPGHSGRHYRVMTRPADGEFIDADQWLKLDTQREGSWWPEWVEWLNHRSGKPVDPPRIGRPSAGLPPLMDLPESYVLQG